ncbi:Protein transport protein Sec61 subunit gamma [Boothiomyces sp. JEL0838]|nr:Protein transport protein Sec61 subunit gamma [Boothiomyces sp. JEL0838]
MDNLQELVDGPRQFVKDSYNLVQRCTKPGRREFLQIAQAVGMGFVLMGFIGFFVKLIHIPINNIIVGTA